MIREPKFVPGERVVILSSKTMPEAVGREDIILSAEFDGIPFGDGTPAQWAYRTVIFQNHTKNYWWIDCQLRKLPPETPATFDASIWVPNKETVK